MSILQSETRSLQIKVSYITKVTYPILEGVVFQRALGNILKKKGPRVHKVPNAVT